MCWVLGSVAVALSGSRLIATLANVFHSFDYSKVAELPEVLQKPLLKTADGSIKGLRSGGRSAIVFVGKQGYRLKGYGSSGLCFCCSWRPRV